jgi:type 1 glutamine amidotransferase
MPDEGSPIVGSGEPPNMRALLLMGGPDYHDQPAHYAELAGILAGEARADLRITTDLEALTPENLANSDAVINWSTFLQPTPAQVDTLLVAVEGGLGFFGIHGGSATFWNSAPYLTMLGSRFLRHDPYKSFRVEIVDRAHPITQGVEDFQVEDELYELGGKIEEFETFAAAVDDKSPYGGDVKALGEGPLGDGIDVLASAEGHPLLYVKTYGKGRVHYNALGHDERALTHPAFRRLVTQGLAWVAGRDT